jgi:hypothetical protein
MAVDVAMLECINASMHLRLPVLRLRRRSSSVRHASMHASQLLRAIFTVHTMRPAASSVKKISRLVCVVCVQLVYRNQHISIYGAITTLDDL